MGNLCERFNGEFSNGFAHSTHPVAGLTITGFPLAAISYDMIVFRDLVKPR